MKPKKKAATLSKSPEKPSSTLKKPSETLEITKYFQRRNAGVKHELGAICVVFC